MKTTWVEGPLFQSVIRPHLPADEEIEDVMFGGGFIEVRTARNAGSQWVHSLFIFSMQGGQWGHKVFTE